MGNLEIKNGTVYIESVADLSPEELKELQTRENIRYVKIEGNYNNNGFETPYSIKEYMDIYDKLEEYTKGIDSDWSDKKKFIYIFRRISMGIDYDHIAGYPEEGNEEQENYSRINGNACRNLKNGLLKGKCVCAGYAEILRHACMLKGVNCRYVHGKTGDEQHAWNIVEIDNGEWIEVDPTWSHEDGIKNIGENKEEFWESHQEANYNYYGSEDYRCLDFPLISNLDLNEFINSEIGIQEKIEYTSSEKAELIGLLEKRDISKDKTVNVNGHVLNLLKQREVLKQRIGYTFEELRSLGFSDTQIENFISYKFDPQTGEKVDKKYVERLIKQKQEKVAEEVTQFEMSSGYTIEQLKSMGFLDMEIESFISCKFDPQTGEKIDRKVFMDKKVQELQQKNSRYTDERKAIESIANGRIHPLAIDKLMENITNGNISFDEAIQIIKCKNDNHNLLDEKCQKIKARLDDSKEERKKCKELEFIKQFEQEVGYTSNQLLDIGFTSEEINEIMHKNFNPQTGEKIDRKAIVEQKIKEKLKTKPMQLKQAYEDIEIKKGDLNQAAGIVRETQKELTMSDIEHGSDKEKMR